MGGRVISPRGSLALTPGLVRCVLEKWSSGCMAAWNGAALGAVRWRRRRRESGGWGQVIGIPLEGWGQVKALDFHLGNDRPRCRRDWFRDFFSMAHWLNLDGSNGGQITLSFVLGVDDKFFLGLHLSWGGTSSSFGRRYVQIIEVADGSQRF